jgi:N-acetylmuramic acid 6-phosphate etherase
VTAARGGWGRLRTESTHPKSRRLDTLSTRALVSLLLAEDERALRAARRTAALVALAADAVARTLSAGGCVLFAGAGTSGRLGVLEAAECPPTFGTSPRQIRATMAGGPRAVFRAIEGAEDHAAAGRRQAAALRPGDLLIGISASGVTPFVRGALEAARRRRASTVLVTCAVVGRGAVADVVVSIATGPEVVAGSTRLKAGSATKAVLNAITTAAMVRLGKTYGPYMVDLRAGSAKLRDRACRIVGAVTSTTSARADRVLRRAGGDVKLAIVMEVRGLAPAAARERLAGAGGRLRKALGPPLAGSRIRRPRRRA